MELSEVTGMLYRMKDMTQLAMERLDNGVSQAQNNIGKVYWLNIRIHNNSQKFTKDEINKAVELETELKRVSACYKDMSQMAHEILLEIDTYIDKAKELETSEDDSWEIELGKTMKLGELNEKILKCLEESKNCLDIQDDLFRKEQEFENTLRKRLSGKGDWYFKLRSIFKGVMN
jgi:hypothetical protein